MRGKRKKGKRDREGAEWGGICLANCRSGKGNRESKNKKNQDKLNKRMKRQYTRSKEEEEGGSVMKRKMIK